MSKSKKIDLVILLIYPILAVFISHLLKINFLGSLVVFLGVPSLYLTIKGWKFAKRASVFALISIPLAIVLDYIGHLTGQWLLPFSMFSRIFEYVSVEMIFWSFINFYFIVMFYEYFVHQHFAGKLWYSKLKYLIISVLVVFILFLSFYNFLPSYLHIPYFYLGFTIVLVLIPILLQLFKYPRFISKFFETAAYFFYLTLLYEITALQLGWWSFPSEQFIGWVSIGNIRFPLEELIFWMILCAMAVLSYYEYFDDREK